MAGACDLAATRPRQHRRPHPDPRHPPGRPRGDVLRRGVRRGLEDHRRRPVVAAARRRPQQHRGQLDGDAPRGSGRALRGHWRGLLPRGGARDLAAAARRGHLPDRRRRRDLGAAPRDRLGRLPLGQRPGHHCPPAGPAVRGHADRRLALGGPRRDLGADPGVGRARRVPGPRAADRHRRRLALRGLRHARAGDRVPPGDERRRPVGSRALGSGHGSDHARRRPLRPAGHLRARRFQPAGPGRALRAGVARGLPLDGWR